MFRKIQSVWKRTYLKRSLYIFILIMCGTSLLFLNRLHQPTEQAGRELPSSFHHFSLSMKDIWSFYNPNSIGLSDLKTETENRNFTDVSVTSGVLLKPMVQKQVTTSSNIITDNCQYSNLNLIQLVDKIEKPQYNCSNLKVFGQIRFQVGGLLKMRFPIDGQKWICFDSTTRMRPGQCIVYSFGINNQWSFDDDMDRFGCKVYSFDPTMGVKNHTRGQHIQFFNLGISNFTGIMKLRRNDSKVARLEDIVKMLGHENDVIDYLKVDVEGWEVNMMEDIWQTSPHILSDHVAQIGMEIHLDGPSAEIRKKKIEKYSKLLFRLECLGFQIITHEENPIMLTAPPLSHELDRPVSCCYEIVWVNRKFL